MMTPFKWVFVSVLGIVFILSIAYISSMQNITMNTTSEIEVLADTINSGLIRSDMDDDGSARGIERKFVTNQESANYDEDGYTGILEEYVHSGDYEPEHTKFVTVETGSNQATPAYESIEYAMLVGSSNTEGYSGELDLVYSDVTPEGRRELIYEGNVTKPAEDTRVYRYQGYVTRENDENINYTDKEELIANMTAIVVSVQKNHPYDIRLDYIFFDENENQTEENNDIRSLQFRVAFVNEDGELKGSSERHLTLDELTEG